VYLFKHALVQDAAYQSLLKSRRQQSHQQVARILEERFPDLKETQPELLAHHYTEANLIGQALPYWRQAGQRAIERSANMEAISHLTKGLQLLKPLPDTPERTQQELTLQTTLGPVLMAAKGFAAPEVERAYARALELCRQMGETPRLFQVLLGMALFYCVRGELQTARELGEQSLSLAQRSQDPARLLQAHCALGTVLYQLGEFVPAREHLEQGIAFYDPRKSRLQDPRAGVGCLSYVALTLWQLGYPEQALKRSREALAQAQGRSHPFSLALALDWTAWLHQLRREGRAAQERAEAAIAVSTEHGFPTWLVMGTLWRGWALAEQGQGEEGVAQICQSLAAWQAMGAEGARSYFLALLAEAHEKTGQTEEGLSVLAEALAVVEKTEERCYGAELYRLKGQLVLQSAVHSPQSKQVSDKSQASQDMSEVPSTQPPIPNPYAEAEAEACFLKAIEVAQKQQAKSLELRATMSLARLWQQQGKKAEARALLAPVYNWFTEGFDTKDLQEAKALLEELTQ
jgi:predicted ATPase